MEQHHRVNTRKGYMACLLRPPHLKKVDTPEFTSFKIRTCDIGFRQPEVTFIHQQVTTCNYNVTYIMALGLPLYDRCIFMAVHYNFYITKFVGDLR
jgi:hypothetical protein